MVRFKTIAHTNIPSYEITEYGFDKLKVKKSARFIQKVKGYTKIMNIIFRSSWLAASKLLGSAGGFFHI